MFDGIDLSKINMNDIIQQAEKFKSDLENKNQNQIFTSKTGGGMIELSINSNSEVVDLKIDDSLLEDKDSLKVLIISAINDVIKQSNSKKTDLFADIVGNIKNLQK